MMQVGVRKFQNDQTSCLPRRGGNSFENGALMTLNDRFLIRYFDPERDMDAVYRCNVESFYHNSWPLMDHAEPRLLKDTILAAVEMGDAPIVAEADGEVRGMLVGGFPKERFAILRAIKAWGKVLLKVATRQYTMTAFGRAAFWRHVTGEFSFIVRGLGTPAEVLMLISQKDYRHGIGRAMMDAWVAEVRAKGHDHTTVSTDSTVSWQFYERYGFRRTHEFPLKMYFYSLPGEDVRGYIYRYDI